MATPKKKAASADKTAKPAKTTRAKKAAVVVPEPVVHVSAFKVGSRVTHPVFGDGQVTAIDRDQLSIKFAASEKVILESFVKGGSKS